MEIDYYEYVYLAQQGDHDKLVELLASFNPVIRSSCYKVKRSLQDDLNQVIIERLIEKIKSFDLHAVPNYSEYCRNIESIQAHTCNE